MNRTRRFIVSGVLLCLFLQAPMAQAERLSSPRRDLATVMFCGLGGAILGLSTLSFYGKPGDHVSNIYYGLGLGLIGGTAYVLSVPSEERSWSRESFSEPSRVVARAPSSLPLWSWEWTLP